jgi:hypothetical protein
MKFIHRPLLATLFVNAAALLASQAALASDVTTSVAPPDHPYRHEVVPKQAPSGYVWAAGHWEWTGKSYSWTPGTWIRERRGQVWVADRWEQDGSQWHYTPGHWDPQNPSERGAPLQAQGQR